MFHNVYIKVYTTTWRVKMRLVYEKTGVEVKEGDKVTLRDNVPATVAYITPPHKPSSTGRVGVVVGSSHDTEHQMEYFPSVIEAVWIDREDQPPIGPGPLTVTRPVRVKASVLARRPDLKHYEGQLGRGRWADNGLLGHVMVLWPGLSCSSFWNENDLENV